ncbi:MAG: ABC transporter permease, partial [Halanaerobiaceae bacterium]|nr:ABC transporter permease [Halanaerobiaceae bacterium]
VIMNRPLTAIDLSVDYLADRNQEASNIVLVFYAIIAMFSLYGIFAGIETVSLLQANLSYVGIRINVTPLKKGNFLLAGIIVALILNLLSNVILLIFISCVLKIPLFSELLYSAIIIIMGNLLGVALGVFIGASNKKSNDTKTLMGIVITLVLSFFSGMMGPDIKVFIDQKLPVLARLNPISIISNSLYRINLLGSTRNIREGFMVLSLYCMVLILASYIFLRRKKYDSV